MELACSKNVKFGEKKKENEIVLNEDSGHHLVIDFSSSESPSESQAPVESVPQQVFEMMVKNK